MRTRPPTRPPRAMCRASILLGATAGAGWLGRTALAGPPLGRPGAWSQWVANVGPVVATFAMLRLLVLAGTTYLLGAAGLALVARAVEYQWADRPATRALRMVRRLLAPQLVLRVALGGGAAALLAGTTATPAASATTTPAARAATTPATSATATPAAPSRLPSTAVRLAPPTLSPAAPPILRGSPTTPGPAPPPTAGPPPPSSPPSKPAAGIRSGSLNPPAVPPAAPTDRHLRLWVVRPGDSLWSIAAEAARSRHVHAPGAIAAYWWRVVEVNRPHLPDPDDPDLLFPGDVVRLPPI